MTQKSKNLFSKMQGILKKGTVAMLCMTLFLFLLAAGCKKVSLIDEIPTIRQEAEQDCEFKNPLTDLPWLKAKVDEITLLFQGKPSLIIIYQCTYGDGKTGFLVDEGNIKPFYNCKGEILCTMGGFVGESCSELNIVSQELIWKVENGFINDSCEFDNPLTDLPWLKKIVEDFVSYSEVVGKRHFQIYQCVYTGEDNEKIGFIVTPICVGLECIDIARLYKCTGSSLCNMGGIMGACEEFNITNKKLIWEINN
jgi:hypothetical protein